MVQGHAYVEVEVRVHAQDHPALGGLLPFGADRLHVPIPFRSRSHFKTRGAAENGRYCEGSRHRRRAPIRSRCCSGPGRPAGDAEASGRRVTSKAPLRPTWKGGQTGPKHRPQPSSRILTAWKVNSANRTSALRSSKKFVIRKQRPSNRKDGPFELYACANTGVCYACY